MKSFNVHFSYYSEEYGQFDENRYTVEAGDQFEARQKAWGIVDSDDNRRFMSCLRQCGVTWEATPANMEDYLNAMAASYKCRIKAIENVDMPNAAIRKDEDAQTRAKSERGYFIGCLDSVSDIAKDIGKPFGMTPPDLFEEFHYAEGFVGEIESGGNYEHAWLLSQRIEAAKKWDRGAMFSLRQLFKDGYTVLDGEVSLLSKYFAQNSVFPEKADLTDRDSQYIWRWQKARPIERLSGLPMFGEKDVISGSESWKSKMSYEYRVLVINPNSLPKEMQTPENMLWMPVVEGDNVRYAQNLITDRFMNLTRDDFIGILRPEYEKNIDFAGLNYEYGLSHDKTPVNEDNAALDIEDDELADEYF